MNHFGGTATADVAATPSDIFELITDFERLPEWNCCIVARRRGPGRHASIAMSKRS